jgi:formate dehydrogenase subunit delta
MLAVNHAGVFALIMPVFPRLPGRSKTPMHVENLVKMANNISSFFQAETDHSLAVAGVADHIRKFWDPRMRKQILTHLHEGGVGLSDLAKEGLEKLDKESASLASGG